MTRKPIKSVDIYHGLDESGKTQVSVTRVVPNPKGDYDYLTSFYHPTAASLERLQAYFGLWAQAPHLEYAGWSVWLYAWTKRTCIEYNRSRKALEQ